MNKLDVLVTGAGGQGVVLASDIIAEVAISSGYDVKKTDTLGMAQRGGSVVSNLRLAPHVHSPLIEKGNADILLGFEKLEAARWAHFLRPEGIAIVNNHALPPPSVSRGLEQYPDDYRVKEILSQRSGHLYFVDATKRAEELGNVKTLNVFILGCVSCFMPFESSIWIGCISERLPEKIRQINLTAFEAGRKELENARC